MKRTFNFPDMLLYQDLYVWVEDRGRGIYRIGLTDYAQYELDDVISITLPEEGIHVNKGEEIVSVDAIEDNYILRAPISGKIVEVNDSLRQNPELINESPYGEGWILEIELANEDDLDDLIDANDASDLLQEELHSEESEEDYEDYDEYDEYEDYDEEFGEYDEYDDYDSYDEYEY